MALQSSDRVWQESRLLSLMISIVDNTTEQASKLDVSFQLDFYLNKQANLAYAPGLVCITQQFLYPKYGEWASPGNQLQWTLNWDVLDFHPFQKH